MRLEAAKKAGLLLILSILFYDSLTALIFLSPLLLPLLGQVRRRQRDEDNREAEAEFLDLMRYMGTGIRAGYSAENALIAAAGDLRMLYGDRSIIVREVERMKRGLESHMPIDLLLSEMGERYASEDIRSFAEVMAIAQRTGGNLGKIVSRSARVLEVKAEVEREIAVQTSAKRLEANLMLCTPLFILLYLRLSMGDYMEVLYRNPAGILSMSACLALYFAAFLLSEHIISIRM